METAAQPMVSPSSGPASRAAPASQGARAAPASPASRAAPGSPAAAPRPGASPGGRGLRNRSHHHNRKKKEDSLAKTAPKSPSKSSAKSNVVQITGFPDYTRAQDLISIFSRFGPMNIEKLGRDVAYLSYQNHADAARAVEASNKVVIYGSILTVQAFSGAIPVNQSPRKKREFPKTKNKDVIVPPSEIDLQGDFSQQSESVLAAVRLTQQEAARVAALYDDLETILQRLWPGCQAHPFGSITTGLGIKTSDADCLVQIPRSFHSPATNFVHKAKRALQQHPDVFDEIIAIPGANTPIVKFFHIPTSTKCDVSFKTLLGVRNSKLIAFLLHSDPRLLPLAVLIKYWAKVHDLSGTGKLTNYALTMMIIFYLQHLAVPILPSVAKLQSAVGEFEVDFWNTGFLDRPFPKSSNTTSIADLLGGFFEFYNDFSFDETVVCPYLGYPIKKDLFKDINLLPNEYARYKHNVANGNTYPLKFTTNMCVQDPFEQSHNVASAVSSRMFLTIKSYIKFAATAYEKEKPENCQGFLKTILLEKPKNLKSKCPEFLVKLYPRIVASIADPDWKAVVRDTVSTIFEDMLKIKLAKFDVKRKVDEKTKREREKYSAGLKRAVWKRKQFNRVYSVIALPTREKQRKITEEVLRVEKEEIDLQFLVTIIFRPAPNRAVVSIRQTDGDLDLFKEFGRFLLSVMQQWFLNLVRPYRAPNDKVPQGPETTAQGLEVNTAQGLEGDAEEDDSDSESDSDSKEEVVKSLVITNSKILDTVRDGSAIASMSLN